MQVSRLLSALSATVFSAVLIGCGGGADAAAPAATVLASPATATAANDATAKPSKVAEPDPETKTLPNVVGLNLQDGQNTLQTVGFYLLDDKDATGQNRFQILDRNWVITEQDPAAGQEVSTDTKITLYAKKYGE
ncbi:PASTA domain-containing protein [Streptosporangium subroseum]|uniref:PASTA domain-containing protein n=1 Tax=Streptosporangium subroseum TaxID=106412 RepID=A0A239EBF5_9ACTN|nr:PASTA domain-containing protein [Streptosporangium subroseum]SNS42090.1 PASTA domain-containing protein [Streptosporangium subroseum]